LGQAINHLIKVANLGDLNPAWVTQAQPCKSISGTQWLGTSEPLGFQSLSEHNKDNFADCNDELYELFGLLDSQS